MDNLRLSQLNAQARGIGAAKDASDAAHADKTTASTELLAAVVEAIRPALRAMSSRIVVKRTMTKEGKTEDFLGEPGVYLASLGPKPGPGPTPTAGSWQGTDVFLCREGSFAMLSYDGDYDRDGVSKWEAAVVELVARDVVDMFPLPVVLDAITRAMAEQAGPGTARRTQKIQEQAERLRALTKLVNSL